MISKMKNCTGKQKSHKKIGEYEMRLQQEIFAEALWVEWFVNYGNVCEKLPDLLRRYNLKFKKRKTYMMLN